MEKKIQQEATLKDATKVGLSIEHFEKLQKALGKAPSFGEVIIYSATIAEKYRYEILNSLLDEHSIKPSQTIKLKDGLSYELEVVCDSSHKKIENIDSSTILAQMNFLCFGTIDNEETKNSFKNYIETDSEIANKNEFQQLQGSLFFDGSFIKQAITNTLVLESTTTNKSKEGLLFNWKSKNIIRVISSHLEIEATDIHIQSDENFVSYSYKNGVIAQLPLSLILDKVRMNTEIDETPQNESTKSFNIENIEEPDDLKEVASFLLKHPNIASQRWINNQYSSIRTAKSQSNAGIFTLKDSKTGLCMAMNSNPRYVKADPEKGTSIAVAEVARKIICSGGEPTAIAACINHPNSNSLDSQKNIKESIDGLLVSSKAVKTPISKINFSSYNSNNQLGESQSNSLTPAVGMIGLLSEKNKTMSFDFKHKGDLIFILGEAVECIASSEYLSSFHGVKESPAPYFNINKEYEMQEVVKSLIQEDLVNAVHDCSRNGVFIALTEMSMPNELGYDIVTDAEIREDAFLFGEAKGRVIVAVNEANEYDFIDYMLETKVNFTLLGHVTQGKLVIDDDHYGFIQEAKRNYNTALGDLI